MSDEMSDEIRVGAAQRGGHQDTTNGFQSLHEKSPLENLIAMEDAEDRDRDQVRVEAMRSFVSYLFSDRQPQNLRFATRRLYAVAREYYPAVLKGATMDCMREIFRIAESETGLRYDESLRTVLEGDEFDVRDETIGRLIYFLFVDEKAGEPWFAMRKLYCLAKAFVPEAIDGMSLEKLGSVFGEDGERSARARWSARVKVYLESKIQKAGGVAHFKYQKSKSPCRKYAAAQQGNQNRKKS